MHSISVFIKSYCFCIVVLCYNDVLGWKTLPTGGIKSTQTASWLWCFRGLSCNNGRWLGVFFLFSLFLSWQPDVKSDPKWRLSPLLSVQTRRSPQRDGAAQGNRSMAAEQEQREPPRVISPSGAQINSYCPGRRWCIGCITGRVLFTLFFSNRAMALGRVRGGVEQACGAGLEKTQSPARLENDLAVRKVFSFASQSWE